MYNWSPKKTGRAWIYLQKGPVFFLSSWKISTHRATKLNESLWNATELEIAKFGGTVLPDFNIYYKATLTKTGIAIKIDQENRRESRIRSHTHYGQLILTKVQRQYRRKKDSILNQ